MKLRVLLLFVAVAVIAVRPAGAFTWLDDEDTTAPVITINGPTTAEATTPDGAVVNFNPTATDETDPPNPAVVCTPANGSVFAVGTTPVHCEATDTAGNTGKTDFTVTVTLVDNTPPVLSLPSPIAVQTENPLGTTVPYSASATDNLDPSPTVSCSPPPGSNFPPGQTTVNCTATDNANNQSTGSFTVTVTLVDHTAPVLSLPSSFSADTESPSGRTVTYSATAIDNIDASPTVSCTPSSGSNFPLGTTTVNCTATDDANNQSTGSFTITVNLVDHTPPTFTGVPASRTVEANGPSGSVATYIKPTATDNLDGPIATVNCTPPPGSLFPLGATTVDCSASDSHGNVGHATFAIVVDDTTPPAIYLPTSASILATSAAGISSSEPAAQRYFNAARAIDMIDPHPALTYEAPSQLRVGPNTVVFHTRDASGNESEKSATLTVLPVGSATPPPPTPGNIPAEVKNVRVTPLDGAALIQWNAGGRRVEVIRSTSATRQLSALVDEKIVYTGTASRYIDRGLLNGVEYRYVVRAVDAGGNHSPGVAVNVTPRIDLLRSPKNGARLKKAPKLVWKADGEADYYNAQLMLNGVKVLSVWPNRASYALKKTWKYNGRKYTLKPGLYTWFVWPGYGSRSRVDYGPMMGSRTFRIVR